MIFNHILEEKALDLRSCIENHSADEIVAYKMVDGEPITLGLFLPSQYHSNSNYPTIFFIHGGGWTSHQIFADQKEWQGDHLGYLARYYADKGYIGISIDYRLLQDMGQKENYQLADLYADCVDAVNYVLDRADEYRIDMENVYLLGESAGGHLAGMIATKYKREGFQFQTVFLFNPLTDFVDDEEWRKRVLSGAEQGKYAKELSPLYNIQADICPVILVHGKKDTTVNPQHSEAFYKKMCEIGRKSELHFIDETGHAFLLAEYTKNMTACKIGISILDGILKESK